MEKRCDECMAYKAGKCHLTPMIGGFVEVRADDWCLQHTPITGETKNINSDIVDKIINLLGDKAISIRDFAGLIADNGIVRTSTEAERWIKFMVSKDYLQTYDIKRGVTPVRLYYNEDFHTPPQKKGDKK